MLAHAKISWEPRVLSTCKLKLGLICCWGWDQRRPGRFLLTKDMPNSPVTSKSASPTESRCFSTNPNGFRVSPAPTTIAGLGTSSMGIVSTLYWNRLALRPLRYWSESRQITQTVKEMQRSQVSRSHSSPLDLALRYLEGRSRSGCAMRKTLVPMEFLLHLRNRYHKVNCH